MKLIEGAIWIAGLFIASAIVKTIGTMLEKEIGGQLNSFYRWVVWYATKTMPEPDKTRWVLELSADLEFFNDKPISKLMHALDTLWKSQQLINIVGEEKDNLDKSPNEKSERLWLMKLSLFSSSALLSGLFSFAEILVKDASPTHRNPMFLIIAGFLLVLSLVGVFLVFREIPKEIDTDKLD